MNKYNVVKPNELVKELRQLKGVHHTEDLIIGKAKIYIEKDHIVFENVETGEKVSKSAYKMALEIVKEIRKRRKEFKVYYKQQLAKEKEAKSWLNQ